MLFLSLHSKFVYSLLSDVIYQFLLLATVTLSCYVLFTHVRHEPIVELVAGLTCGRDEKVNIVICYDGEELNRWDQERLTPLLRAARCGHYNILQTILKTGFKVNDSEKDMRTALIMASCKGHLNVVDLLLRHGARISSKDKDGNTALILAAEKGFVDVVKLLIQYGAEINWKNAYGLSSLNAGVKYSCYIFVPLFMWKKFTIVHIYPFYVDAYQSFVGMEGRTVSYQGGSIFDPSRGVCRYNRQSWADPVV